MVKKCFSFLRLEIIKKSEKPTEIKNLLKISCLSRKPGSYKKKSNSPRTLPPPLFRY